MICNRNFTLEVVTNCLRIANYGGTEPLFAPAAMALPSTDPEWDGKFCYDPGVNWTYSAGPTWFATPFSVSGFQLVLVYVVSPAMGIPNVWQVYIASTSFGGINNFGIIWYGTKTGGDTSTPVGVYLRGDGSDARASISLTF